MKHILNITLILLLCAATSCIRDTDTGIGKTDGPLPVKLNLQLPSDMKGGVSSRSMAVEDESAISSVELLAFLDDGGGDYRYTYSAPIESTVNNNGQVEIVATAQGYSGQQIFMVLVNAPAGASSGIVRNMALADARQQLLVASANEWNAASSADYKPLPMYAETSAATVTVGTTLGNYDLVRMLARIDVRLRAGVSNFVVTEAHLFNRKTSGQMAFPFDAATWDAANKRVRKTTYPQAAIPSAYKPSYYDISGYASTPYGADYTDDSRGEILRSVYTFEAKGVSEADRLDATAVVVGGKYNGSSEVTYYRVDIKTDATPAGYVSQDIFRNHLYDIEIQSVAGAGAQTPEDAFKGDVHFKAEVTAYNLAQCGVIFDRQYKLQLSDEQFYFGNEGGSPTITVTTDYDGADRAHPAGLFISTAGTASWLTVTPGGANGDMSRTVTLTATAYPSASADRETSFTVTAGNLNYKYKVTQSKDPWLTVDADEANLLDGGTKYMQVSSYFNWNVSIKAGTNPYNLVRSLFSTSGGKKMNEKLYYTVYDNMSLQNPAYDLNFVTLTFTHPEGIYPDKEVSIGLVTGIFRESSNCYILNPGSRPILIPLARANQSDLGTLIGQSDQLRSEFVWSDNPNGLAANSNIKYVTSVDRGQGGYMYVSPGSEEGNAVVGVKTGGNICWSWHIWMLDATNTLQAIDGLMDRDLGAVSAGPWVFPRPPAAMGGPGHDTSQEPAVGLNYQWGRKDPFPTTGIRAASGVNPTTGYITGNTLLTSIRNPNSVINDWDYPAGNNSYSWPAKSLYDPCPEGWIVSPIESWQVTAQPLIFVDAFEGRTSNGNFIPCYQYGGSGAWVHSSWLSSPTSNVWTLALYNWTSGIYVNSSGSTPAAGQFPVRCVRE